MNTQINPNDILVSTPAERIAGVLAQRQPGAEGMGSRFLRETGVVDIRTADWQPYNHPEIKEPAIGFKAPLPGRIGIVRLDSLPAEQEVQLLDGHDTSFVEAVVFIGELGSQVEHTTLLLGPCGEEIGLWTFFPGDPINPSTLPASEYQGRKLTVAEALELGLEWAKIGG